MVKTQLPELIRNRQFSQACKVLDQLIKEYSSRSTAELNALLCNRGWVYIQLGLPRKALKDLDAVLLKDGNNVTALVRKAEAFQLLGKKEEAHKLVERALGAFSVFTDASLILEAQAVITGRTSASPKPTANGSAKITKETLQPQSSPQSASSSSTTITAENGIPDALLPDSVIVSRAVELINAGNTKQAEASLQRIVDKNPRDFASRLARGTARALQRDLEGAVDDFSVAIDILPGYHDTWKRRGQARAALGQHEAALADLEQALGLTTEGKLKAECHFEQGMVFHKMKDFRNAARQFRASVNLDVGSPQTWNLLGLCLTSLGDIEEGVAAYLQAVAMKPDFREGWINMAHALKEAARVEEAEAAFKRGMALDPPGKPSQQALRLLAQMRQGCGLHRQAVELMTKALRTAEGDHRVECLYWRAVCNHALGYHKAAMEDYEACFNVPPDSLADDTKTLQLLAFYQKEMALYCRHNLDRPVNTFCPDQDLHPVFKELWCKKGPPTQEFLSLFVNIRQPPIPRSPPPPPPPPPAERMAVLLTQADSLGLLLQYSHQGFLPNRRQQRMGGLAAIEVAQTMRQLVLCRREGRELWVSSEGGSSGGGAGRHVCGWRDVMDQLVKWRQLAEPNDQVLWVDLLTKAEFEAGFGSHTPLFSGQTKCVRYYMNFRRALGLHKKVLLEEGHAFNAQNNKVPLDTEDKRRRAQAAESAEDMYLVLGQDSWVVVPIGSLRQAGHSLEGTRLTLVKVPNQPSAYEFSIRTPVTPQRWKEFDKELEAAFERVVEALCGDDKPLIAREILQYCYYWYNFMPLARGTAVVGYVALLGLFMAAGMPVTARIPKDYQTDWEAILAQEAGHFVESLAQWVLPPAARGEVMDLPDHAARWADVDSLPSVAETLPTMRLRLEALNGPDAPRI